jgi:hypothetical protein
MAKKKITDKELEDIWKGMKDLPIIGKKPDPILPPPVEAMARQFAKEYGGTWQDYVKDAEVAARGLVRNNFYPIDPSALVAEGMIDLWMQKDEAKARIHIIGRISNNMIQALKAAYHAYV